MMHTRAAIVVLLLLLPLSVVFAQVPKSEAAGHYLAGFAAYQNGQLDKAISEYREALRLKPDSSLTKDRLIQALSLKLGQLENDLVAAKAAATQSREASIAEQQVPLRDDKVLAPPAAVSQEQQEEQQRQKQLQQARQKRLEEEQQKWAREEQHRRFLQQTSMQLQFRQWEKQKILQQRKDLERFAQQNRLRQQRLLPHKQGRP